MKSKEQIINDSIKLETPPEDYNLLETHCFLALKQLLIMFHNKQISQLNATIMKNKILVKYESDSKQYEFERSMFQEYIEHIKQKHDTDICPFCGKKLIKRTGKYGQFMGCTGYPKCKYTRQIDK